MIDLLLTKLYLERKFDMLIELLNYCAANNGVLSHIKNIEQKWFYAAQWLFSSEGMFHVKELKKFCMSSNQLLTQRNS